MPARFGLLEYSDMHPKEARHDNDNDDDANNVEDHCLTFPKM
jgi:hypothetical protein